MDNLPNSQSDIVPQKQCRHSYEFISQVTIGSVFHSITINSSEAYYKSNKANQYQPKSIKNVFELFVKELKKSGSYPAPLIY